MNECFVWKWKGLTLKRPREDRSEENRNDLVTRIKTLEFPPDHLSTVHGCNDVSVRSQSGCSGPRPRQPRYLAAAVSPLLCPIGKSPVARLGPRQQHRIPTVPLHSPPLLWLQRFHTMYPQSSDENKAFCRVEFADGSLCVVRWKLYGMWINDPVKCNIGVKELNWYVDRYDIMDIMRWCLK